MCFKLISSSIPLSVSPISYSQITPVHLICLFLSTYYFPSHCWIYCLHMLPLMQLMSATRESALHGLVLAFLIVKKAQNSFCEMVHVQNLCEARKYGISPVLTFIAATAMLLAQLKSNSCGMSQRTACYATVLCTEMAFKWRKDEEWYVERKVVFLNAGLL